MKNILILGAAMFALSGCLSSDNADYEYALACDGFADSSLDCGDLPVPAVEYFDGADKPGLRGYYKGGYTIFINEDLKPREESSVKFHEIVHYLQVHRAGLKVPGPAKQICAAEAMAFKYTDIYRKHLGLPLVGPNWWRPYVYCWVYYAPAGSQLAILKLPTGEVIIDLLPE